MASWEGEGMGRGLVGLGMDRGVVGEKMNTGIEEEAGDVETPFSGAFRLF